jgi:glutathione S-transferase
MMPPPRIRRFGRFLTDDFRRYVPLYSWPGRYVPLRFAIGFVAGKYCQEDYDMLALYYGPGACSMASHIVLEESGEKYEPMKMDLAKGEQRTEAYLKINPLGRVPVLRLDNGEALAENTAILPYLGKRFDLWPKDPVGEAKALSVIGFFATSVHPAHAHVGRPERYASDTGAFPTIKEMGLKSFHGYLKQIDGVLAGREWLSDRYSVLDPYGLVFYTWGLRRELPMAELKNYTAFKDRMLKRPAVGRVVEDEKIKV